MKHPIIFRNQFSMVFISIILLNSLLFLNACSDTNSKKGSDSSTVAVNEGEQYRLAFHFTPQKNWMNDPNGMFYLDGKFHLYFQHHPDSNVWGPMHWGHATSEDLMNWEEHEIALFPDELGTIFSGSAVVDYQNTSGLGTKENPPIVAIYTNHDADGEKAGSLTFQNQSIAYSNDKGYTWTKYSKNPVVKNPGIKDFRDPKVFWMENQQKWIMALAAGQEIQYYESKNLIDWSYKSSFGTGIGNHDGVWECPDLFPLTIEGTETVKWVHLVSINPGGPNGGSATQYFIGDFDGNQFTLDPEFKVDIEKSHRFWADFGRDNYAGVTFSNWRTDDKKKPLFLGWMSNWLYGTIVPTYNWRSAMTLPRNLELSKTKEGYILKSTLAVDWDSFTTNKGNIVETKIEGNTTIVPPNTLDLSAAKINIQLKNLESTTYTFELANQYGDTLSFGYDHKAKQFFINRSKSGKVDFSPEFTKGPSTAPRFSDDDMISLEFVLDKMSIELFYDSGEAVMTEIFFPNAPYQTLTLRTDDPTNTKYSATILEVNPSKNKE
jgi:levanase/fructan beta-fructosidase